MLRASYAAIFTTALLFVQTSSCSAEVKIVSWNIANLASGPDVDLRGQIRSEDDYEYLRAKLAEIDADVVALQEIGSIPAAKRILGDEYEVVFESRCIQNPSACMADNDDIYTAIAYRIGLPQFEGTFQIDELAIDHTDECVETHSVRGGVGVMLTIGGRNAWVPSLHIKSACKDNTEEDGTDDDCATQKKQYDILVDWISARPDGDFVILAGDMNRKLLTLSDNIRKDVFELHFPMVQFLPVKEGRMCWAESTVNFADVTEEVGLSNPEFKDQGMTPKIYEPRYNSEVDFFVVIDPLNQTNFRSSQVQLDGDMRVTGPFATLLTCEKKIKPLYGKTAWAFGKVYPTDHCPIVLNIEE